MTNDICDLELVVVEQGESGFFQSSPYTLRWEATVKKPYGNIKLYESEDFSINRTTYIDVDTIEPDDFDEVNEEYNRMINYLETKGWRKKSERNGWYDQMTLDGTDEEA